MENSPQYNFWKQSLMWITSVPLIILGLMVFYGWVIREPLLIQISEEFPAMQANTSLCFILSGASFLLSFFHKKLLACLAAFAVLIITGLTICEYLFDINLGIDQIFFKYSIPEGLKFPGRIAPNTATCFFLSGIALIFTALPYRRISSVICEILSGATAAISAVALFGYMTGLSSVVGWSDFTGMAIHTSIGLLLLGLGIFHYHFLLSLQEDKFSYGPILGNIFFQWESQSLFGKVSRHSNILQFKI